MAALNPDERCLVLASLIFFLLIQTQHSIKGTSAATYKVMEPYGMIQQFFISQPPVCFFKPVINGYFYFIYQYFFQTLSMKCFRTGSYPKILSQRELNCGPFSCEPTILTTRPPPRSYPIQFLLKCDIFR